VSAPRQGRKAGTSPRPAGKTRDRGTRGGRPDAQPAARRQAAGARAGGSRNGTVDDRARAGASAARVAKPHPSKAVPEAATEGGVPRWLQWVTLVLSLAGLGVSIYLTIAHYTTKVSLACPNTGTINCQKVTTSAESVVFGVPVAVLGLAFFVFMVAMTTPWFWRGSGPLAQLSTLIGRARLVSVIVGIAFVLYLVYTEVITLNMTICLWCTAVHVITFLLFGLIVYAATARYGVAKPPPGRRSNQTALPGAGRSK
jgi:uncharacterized membrane protein